MSDQHPPDEPPPDSPFPESSLGSGDDPDGAPAHPQADPPPHAGGLQPPAPPPPPRDVAATPPAPAEGGAWTESTGPGPQSAGAWAQPAAPGAGSSLWSESPPPPPAPMPPPPQPGVSAGDPLGGSSYPQGYTSPPPPGAGGGPPALGAPGGGTYVLSGWWRRVGAAIVDGLIIGVIALAIMAPLGLGFFSLDDTDTAGFFALVGAFIVAVLVIAVVALAYAPVMMGATNGKTLGRMVTGIRVVRADGQDMTFGWAALREVVVKALLINGIAGSFTFGLAGLVDVLWPLWDDENRALHDFVVNTRTVLD